jgi:hypothetical protein
MLDYASSTRTELILYWPIFVLAVKFKEYLDG